MSTVDGATGGSRRPSRVVLLGLAAILLAGAGVATWFRLFSTFAPYDDEGCFLVTARAVARGAPLYDEVHSLYGPAFALLDTAYHQLLGLPFDHEVARWRTLVVLLAAAVAGGVLIWRATGSLLLAAAASLLTLHHIERFAAEPGHPQDLSVLLLLVILTLAFGFDRDRRSPGAVATGACLGLLAMLKLNLALFLLVPLLVVLSTSARHRWIWWLPAAMSLAVGPAVVAPELGQPAVWWLLVASGTGLVATLAVAARRPPRLARPLPLAVAIVAAAGLVTATFCVAALARGTTLDGLLHGLILQHRGYLGEFFVPPRVSWSALAAGLLVTVVAAVATVRRPAAAASIHLAAGLAMVAVPAAAHLAAGFRELVSGLEDRGAESFLVGFATPLVWLVVARCGGRGAVACGRLLLALTASLEVLGCYPIAGSQLAGATVLLPLIGLVLIADGLGVCTTAAVRGAILATITALWAAGLIARVGYLPRLYLELEPLGLPGTNAIRTRGEEVERWHWLTAQLAARADTFVFFPFTWNSLYLWTGLEPPTGLNFTDWPGVLSHAEQARVIAALETFDRPYVVWLETSWVPSRWLAEPLTAYIRRRYHLVASHGSVDLLARGRRTTTQ